MAFTYCSGKAGRGSLLAIAGLALSLAFAGPAAAQALHDPDCAEVEYRKERFDQLRADILAAVDPIRGVLDQATVEAVSISPSASGEASLKDVRLAYRDVIEDLVSAGRYESIRGQIILLLPALKRLGDLRVAITKASADQDKSLTISAQQRDQIISALKDEADKLTTLTQCITSHMRSDR